MSTGGFWIRLSLWAVLALLAQATLGPARLQAGSAGAEVAPTVRVSGPSPFLDGCEGPALNSRVYRSTAVEPMLVADPSNPEHLIATWFQDRIASSMGLGVLTAVSDDGGATWTTSTPNFSRCTGGNAGNGADYARAADPWLTIAANGDVYAIALAGSPLQGSATNSAILVVKSTDGGFTWQPPIAVSRDPIDDGFNDKPTITADPANADILYAVWSRELDAEQTSTGLGEEPAYFSRTTDGGQTWEPPREIYAGPGVTTIGHIIVVQPDGELIDVFTRGRRPNGDDPVYDLVLLRSTDRGLTWSPPETIGDVETAPLVDPFSTFPLQPDAGLATIASVGEDARNGRLSVAWQDARFSAGRKIDIAFTTSSDSGHTWSPPIQINQTPGGEPAFVPTLGVASGGEVGVSFYDLRSSNSTESGVPADAWLDFCRHDCNQAGSWSEAHVAGPFDLERAPYAKGYFLGDYEGMTGTAQGFAVLDSLAGPPGSNTSVDANLVSVTLP